VAGLTLARAATRERELALRAALGATRRRVVQLLLIESLLVAVIGTALGLGLATLAMPFLRSLTLGGLGTIRIALRPDLSLLGYGTALTVISAVAIGVLPAWRLSRNLREASVLRDGTAGASPRLGLRFAFVVGQVSGAVVLLALAVMLLRSVDSLREHEAGFDLDRAAVVSIHQDAVSFGRDGGLLQTRMLLDALAADGFEQAAVAAIVPLSGEASATRFRPEGAPHESEGVRTLLNTVGARYFETLGIPLRQGRVFDARDQDGSPPVVVVNERLAQLLFPEGNAIGQRIAAGGEAGVEIVGVVGNTKQRSLGEAPLSLLYYAFEQLPRLSSQVRDLHVHVRTPDEPQGHVRRLENIVRERLGPDAVVTARTLQDAAASEAKLRRAGSQLLSAIGLLGLALAATGLYGAMAYVVATSTRELGIRLALGASATQILMRTVRRGLVLVLMGLAVGLPLAMIAARALGAAVSGLRPSDPVAISGVVALLLVVGAVASYLPARRASRLDPGVVLRRSG
jgi:predicted permease